jgi:hypothetical protein
MDIERTIQGSHSGEYSIRLSKNRYLPIEPFGYGPQLGPVYSLYGGAG